jgi:hypothetical protein
MLRASKYCGLRIEDFAVSGPTAIADLRLIEDCGENRKKHESA